MRHLRAILGTIVVVLAMTSSFLIVLAAVPEIVSAYTAHDPIFIDGDSEFTSANGVTGGSGTASDPYVIEGWEIDATTSPGIQIQDTTAHFTISNCYIDEGVSVQIGIHLIRCVNGTVSANNCSSTSYGIWLSSSSNIILSDNDCSSTYYGIRLDSSCNNSLSGNNCSLSFFDGIYLYSSSNNNTVSDNDCRFNGGHLIPDAGILIRESDNNTLTGNDCSGNYHCGMDISSSSNNTLSGNNCSSNNDDGIRLASLGNNTLSYNDCSHNGDDGIYLTGSGFFSPGYNNTLTYNDCNSNGDSGIHVGSSSDSTLTYNDCSRNGGNGIRLGSSGNTLDHNNCSSNGYGGISLGSSSNNTLRSNNCSSNSDFGIRLWSSNNNTMSDNDCCFNGDDGFYDSGISLSDESCNNTLIRNNCSSNGYAGIELYSSSNNTLSYNGCRFNDYHGILVYSSSSNTLSGDNVSSNGAYGVYLDDSTGTEVCHNIFISNTDHAYDDGGSENSWNASYPLGGNYWDDYTGVDEYSGPDQDQPGPDGIGDTPYEIDADSVDYYPLMAPPNTPPTASFTVSPPTGDVATLFSFDASDSWDLEDQSELLEVRWDFDGDGEWDTDWSTDKTTTHQYAAPGTYIVELEVRDIDGLTGNATATVEVVEAIPEFGSVLVPVLSLLLIAALFEWRRRGRG